jgi:DNA-binding response OmpR family regulator
MRVLVVDDQDDIRALVATVLRSDGFAVSEAEGGNQALAAIATDPPPDVVLLDVQMPDMDGWDTLAAIRNGPHPNLHVILCTVKSGPEDTVQGWALGCDAYITKPFDIIALGETVKAVAARSEDERLEQRRRGLAGAIVRHEHLKA